MKTENSSATFTEKIIDGLRNAATELEKFQVQASLGKAEAKDKYEEARKKMYGFIHEAKMHIDETTSIAKEKAKDIKPLLESLEVQFALGKAETKEIWEEQRKKFAKALSELEMYFKKK